MKGRFFILLHLFCFVFFFMADESYAFSCSGTTNYTVDSITVGEEAINLTLPSSVINCNGDIGTVYTDAVRVAEVILNPKLVSAGFTDTILNVSGFGDYIYPFSDAIYKCVWYDSSCSISSSSYDIVTGNIATFKPTLKRSAGVWPELKMASGETIITIVLQQRSRNAWTGGSSSVWYINYKLGDGGVVNPDRSCAINTYDSTVKLPTIPVSDIRSQNPGRVKSSKTRFNIQLDCKKETRVYLQFKGVNMSGIADVLVNYEVDNINVGAQLYHADTETAITYNTRYLAVNSASTVENLAFDAYYYYRGGDVSPGKIRTHAMFLFNYE
ncbi:fimbrial protein [Klebsiella pasteurii]|uniref:fimbrial protein n=1 Tax=Klebsiella pasteurii TaxID=2587529 RepID=UPI003AB8F5F8